MRGQPERESKGRANDAITNRLMSIQPSIRSVANRKFTGKKSLQTSEMEPSNAYHR